MLTRNKQIKFRVTENEYFKIAATAGRAGYSLSAFIRARCLDDKKILIVDREDIKAVYQALNGMGNNVNQIARIAHAQGVVSKETLLSLLANVRDIRYTVAERLKGVKI